MIGQVALLEMTPNVLEWLLDSMPRLTKLRTVDAIHLATCDYLIRHGQTVAIASYDSRMNVAAIAIEIPLIDR